MRGGERGLDAERLEAMRAQSLWSDLSRSCLVTSKFASPWGGKREFSQRLCG